MAATGAVQEEEQQLIALEEGQDEEPLIMTSPTVWDRGFCSLACAASFTFLLLVLMALYLYQFFGTGVEHDAKWRPTVDILDASNIEELKYVHDVGDYELQGLAVSGNTLYEFHTLGVRVLELDSANGSVVSLKTSRVYDGAVDFPLIVKQHVAHVGGIDFCSSESHGDELWIATHSGGLDGEGAIFAIDPRTLDVISSRAVRVNYNLDWVACKDGDLYFGEFFNVKRIHRVSLDKLETLPDVKLQLPRHLSGGIDYVQSAAFDSEGRLVLLGDDYQCTIYYLDSVTGEFLGSQALLLGSETDGITFDFSRKAMLVGFNRQHSHEQVMGQDPMVSVIQLDLY